MSPEQVYILASAAVPAKPYDASRVGAPRGGACAKRPPGRSARGIGGAVVKSVLATVAALPDRPLSCRAIADRAGCDSSSAACAVSWLRSLGVLTVRPSPRARANEYRVDFARLELMASREPLVDPVGTRRRPKRIRRKVESGVAA